MNVQTRDPLLRRKLASRTPPAPAEGQGAIGPAQGLARSFARAISALVPLVAEQGASARQSVTLSELLDTIDTDAFVGLLAGAEGGPGLVVLDQSAFSAIIEAMTIGRLGPRAPVPRRPTPTDSSLLADLVNHTLRDLQDPVAAAMRFHRPVADHRLLAVMLDDVVFDTISLSVELASGDVRRPGQVMLGLPRAAADPAAPDLVAPGDTKSWGEKLETSVMRSPASLLAELGRITLPLSEVLDLGVGSALTLPLSNLEEVQIVALDGSVQALGRLGQSRGNRAVRLTSWPTGGAPPHRMTDIEGPAPRAATAVGNKLTGGSTEGSRSDLPSSLE